MRYPVAVEKRQRNFAAYVSDLPGCVATIEAFAVRDLPGCKTYSYTTGLKTINGANRPN